MFRVTARGRREASQKEASVAAGDELPPQHNSPPNLSRQTSGTGARDSDHQEIIAGLGLPFLARVSKGRLNVSEASVPTLQRSEVSAQGQIFKNPQQNPREWDVEPVQSPRNEGQIIDTYEDRKGPDSEVASEVHSGPVRPENGQARELEAGHGTPQQPLSSGPGSLTEDAAEPQPFFDRAATELHSGSVGAEKNQAQEPEDDHGDRQQPLSDGPRENHERIIDAYKDRGRLDSDLASEVYSGPFHVETVEAQADQGTPEQPLSGPRRSLLEDFIQPQTAVDQANGHRTRQQPLSGAPGLFSGRAASVVQRGPVGAENDEAQEPQADPGTSQQHFTGPLGSLMEESARLQTVADRAAEQEPSQQPLSGAPDSLIEDAARRQTVIDQAAEQEHPQQPLSGGPGSLIDDAERSQTIDRDASVSSSKFMPRESAFVPGIKVHRPSATAIAASTGPSSMESMDVPSREVPTAPPTTPVGVPATSQDAVSRPLTVTSVPEKVIPDALTLLNAVSPGTASTGRDHVPINPVACESAGSQPDPTGTHTTAKIGRYKRILRQTRQILVTKQVLNFVIGHDLANVVYPKLKQSGRDNAGGPLAMDGSSDFLSAYSRRQERKRDARRKRVEGRIAAARAHAEAETLQSCQNCGGLTHTR